MTSPSKPSPRIALDREIVADWIVHGVGLICGVVGAVGPRAGLLDEVLDEVVFAKHGIPRRQGLVHNRLLAFFAHQTGRHLTGFEPAAREALARHPWPGR